MRRIVFCLDAIQKSYLSVRVEGTLDPVILNGMCFCNWTRMVLLPFMYLCLKRCVTNGHFHYFISFLFFQTNVNFERLTEKDKRRD